MMKITELLRKERESGFSLVEMLVVIIIIGILTAIAVPSYLNQRKTAVDASLATDMKNATTQIETALSTYPEARCVSAFQSAKNLNIKIFSTTTCAAPTAANLNTVQPGQLGTPILSFLSETDNTLAITGDPYSTNGYQIIGKAARGANTNVTYLSNKGGFQ